MSGKNRHTPIPVPSDSDSSSGSDSGSDIEELSGDNIPHYMRKVTNRTDPVELSDDDDGHDCDLPSSSRSRRSSGFPGWDARFKKSKVRKSAAQKAKGRSERSTPISSSKSGRSVASRSTADFIEEDELDSSDEAEVPTDDNTSGRNNTEKREDQGIKDYFADTVAGWEDDADIDKALRQLGLKTTEDTFSDLTKTLLPHQCLGVAWMLDKEKNPWYRGGLLCDAMGLGKTIQMIATIVGNKSQDRRVKTTLVVAPLALLSQWKFEIESKTTDGKLKVAIHHGNSKLRDPVFLRYYDVVLTTYGTLVAEFGSQKPGKRVRRKGPLFDVRWYRVVLDEAHVIRNRLTGMAKAVCELEAVYRWSLTGTLIVNALDDIYTQLRFTNISFCRDWHEFQKHIGKYQRSDPELAAERAQAILKGCMMRRTKDSTLNGRRLLELPAKTTQMEELDFSPDERSIYDALERKVQIQFTKFYREGTVLKHMNCMLIMLLRLRQLCAHPWLLRRNSGERAHPQDFPLELVSDNARIGSSSSDQKELQRAVKLMGQAWVDGAKTRLQERRDLAQAEDSDEDANHGSCAICYDPHNDEVDEVVVNCKHSFCRTCVTEIFTNPPPEQDEVTDDQAQRGARKCPMCRAVIEKDKVFTASALLPPVEESGESDEAAYGQGCNRLVKRRMREVDDIDDGHFNAKRPYQRVKQKSNKGKGKEKARRSDVLPSTKMKHLLTLLEQFLSEKGVKVIVFSQFVSFLELVSKYLDSEGFAHEVYIGPMNIEAREQAVRNFTAPSVNAKSPRVMLISLKCGGVGLNSTEASKVISLDLAWNTATEEQAFDRAHRIGQKKPVDVRRLVITNSIEQRILELQEKKRALADGAMGEGTGGKLGRLSVRDLIQLFNVSARMLRGEDEDEDEDD